MFSVINLFFLFILWSSIEILVLRLRAWFWLSSTQQECHMLWCLHTDITPKSTVNVNSVFSPSGSGSYNHPDDACCWLPGLGCDWTQTRMNLIHFLNLISPKRFWKLYIAWKCWKKNVFWLCLITEREFEEFMNTTNKCFIQKNWSQMINNHLVFCDWTGARRHDDSNWCGWQWDCHSGGVAEGRHEQCAFTRPTWTEGENNIWLHTQHFKVLLQPPLSH